MKEGDENEAEEVEEEEVLELELTFKTEKCGKHDARLIAAIEDHNIAEVSRICSVSPGVS